MAVEEKRIHWTQTPAGRKKVSAATKKGWKTRKKMAASRGSKKVIVRRSPRKELASQLPTTSAHVFEDILRFASGVTFGEVKRLIETTALSSGLPAGLLAERVASLLHESASRGLLGAKSSVPAL